MSIALKNFKEQLVWSVCVASHSPEPDQNPLRSNGFWVAEEISTLDWRAVRKDFRDRDDIQRRWNERTVRNHLKQSVNGLGVSAKEKKI